MEKGQKAQLRFWFSIKCNMECKHFFKYPNIINVAGDSVFVLEIAVSCT